MKLTFLGTGTSFGVPMVGCSCGVCTSKDSRDRRSRHGLMIETAGGRLLVDTPPELRLQLVRAGVDSIDGVFLSHTHADHVHGIDDLRIFSLRSGRPLPTWVAAEFADELVARFSYIWGPDARPGDDTVVPELDLNGFADREPIRVAGQDLTPIGFPHGWYTSYGFRAGDLGVVIDGKRMPEDAIPLLRGVRVLVINALWYGDPHPSHFNVEEAVEASRSVDAEVTYLTHLSHKVGHADLEARLPDGIQPAYDGLTVEL